MFKVVGAVTENGLSLIGTWGCVSVFVFVGSITTKRLSEDRTL